MLELHRQSLKPLRQILTLPISSKDYQVYENLIVSVEGIGAMVEEWSEGRRADIKKQENQLDEQLNELYHARKKLLIEQESKSNMVKMVLGSSDAQGQTMSSVGKARVTAYNSAVKALSNFNGAGDLQGSAYDSGKQYGVSVITPLIKGAIMYSEYLSEAVPKLPQNIGQKLGRRSGFSRT